MASNAAQQVMQASRVRVANKGNYNSGQWMVRLVLVNPVTIIGGAILFGRWYNNPKDSEERNGSGHIAQYRQQRRESMKSYIEGTGQQEDKRNTYNPKFYSGYRINNSSIVKTNSFRPGGKDVVRESPKRKVGIYDSEGQVDAERAEAAAVPRSTVHHKI